jgi:dGTPase
MYRHPRVMGPMNTAKDIVTALFGAFSENPTLLPHDWANACGGPSEARTVSVVRDYIAGMTDRFALSEHARIFRKEIAL